MSNFTSEENKRFFYPLSPSKIEKRNNKILYIELLLMMFRYQCYLNITLRKICIVRKCLVKKIFFFRKGRQVHRMQSNTKLAGEHWEWLNQYFKVSTFISSKRSLKNASLCITLKVYLLLKDLQSTERLPHSCILFGLWGKTNWPRVHDFIRLPPGKWRSRGQTKHIYSQLQTQK